MSHTHEVLSSCSCAAYREQGFGASCSRCSPLPGRMSFTTPAAMLGEALALANRAEMAAFDAHHAMSATAVSDAVNTARVFLIEAVNALKRAMRETASSDQEP